MNNAQFSKSFYFFECNFKRAHHTDNSKGTTCHHIGYIKSGSATFDVEGRIYKFYAGDVFYTPPACKYHSYWEGEKICYDSFAFSVFPAKNEEYCVQKLTLNEKAQKFLLSLSGERGVNATSVGMLYMLLGEVMPTMKQTEVNEKKAAVERALEFMQKDVSLTVPMLARKMGMSVSALYALFSEQISSTPITEKNRIRTEMAVNMLKNTDMSVEEISARLGFSSAAYFRRVLRAFFGKTPREMRKNDNV